MILLVGEVCVDFTLATRSTPAKMRLGGVAHAARGLWACGVPYSVAAVCPAYLDGEAEAFLKAHGCVDFFIIGVTNGAPNVIIIGDAKEIGHQGYEDLLRETRKVKETISQEKMNRYENIVIFPGSYNLTNLAKYINSQARVTIDVAYDIDSIEDIRMLSQNITDIVISTSSDLFLSVGADDVSKLTEFFKPIASRLLLKENRGGSRLFNLQTSEHEEISANLGDTANSVGVGDVYTAVFASFTSSVPNDAVWRGMQVATRYAQTTFPDDLRRDVHRDLRLAAKDVRSLGGVFLPWHERPKFEIYLAAPDFTYLDRADIETAVAALEYHNFVVRRPVSENGEAKPGSPSNILQEFYYKDVQLLHHCAIVFAIPLQRDPGTLVEMGMAMALGKPVITYDPGVQNENTMVICGSFAYSRDLDHCLNATFECLSKLRRDTR